ncbi:pyruvate dehydrogenase complex dihydrolipoamide acetyltransferase [Pinibacter soli]|uniref:Acetyltransferase component of pyruvate dehydrogenase complex n=1 Tax=Pinibacter soli TaxID=3044211 RepID=A0ABT6RIS3_9BACT|nr:pyruvate dehydrogenase complex dihydrolipoamide acetyltransferase [Pinibacter soli]MDI3322464.1 pyruvate dehydrogenase complex dihydrolipoamide acetyltransferase [Pinibacter soli]
MAEEILMPRLSDTMTEGVIAAWHKKVGDTVKKGDLLAEVETDKATMELESYKDGTLLHIGVQNGGKLQVNDLLAIIGAPGEDISGILNKQGGAPAAAPAAEKKEEAPKQEQAPQAAPATGGSVDLSKVEEVILMPRLSDTMTEGVIAEWHKKVGDDVKKGDLLAEIETDKATMELESYKNGKLLYIGAQKGDKVPVNALLCIIGEEGKVDVDKIVASAKGGGTASAGASQPAAAPAQQAAPAAQAAPAQSSSDNGRVKASPLAKKVAEEKGIDISQVPGSGDGGRIIKADVDSYKPAAQQAAPAAKSAPAAASAPAGQVSFDEVPVSQMRKVIAKRLGESLFTAPHFYVTMAIDMDNAIAARTKINEKAAVKISFNDLVLKACAIALKQHPAINSSWLGDKIRVNHHVNIGVAVAVDEGLLVPVVRFADTKSLTQIGAEVKDFAARAKAKKLQPSDWEGSTFTISNLGMFGVDEFTAIINPPDACILAVGGISQVPVVKDGVVKPGNIMKVTLSCDHRVVDGATGAAFLQTLKSFLEEPLRMLV